MLNYWLSGAEIQQILPYSEISICQVTRFTYCWDYAVNGDINKIANIQIKCNKIKH